MPRATRKTANSSRTKARTTTRRKAPARAATDTHAKTTTLEPASTLEVEGTESLRDALDADIRVRVSGALLASVVLVVVLVVLAAAVGASWLFAIPTIALAFIAGGLAARAGRARR